MADHETRGPVVASYLLRVTLRERASQPISEWAAQPMGEPHPEPTIARIEAIVGQALYDDLPYFSDAEIRVTAERVDK